MAWAGIDLTVPWPHFNNNVYIIKFIDHFSKWDDAVPLPKTQNVVTMA
jgi:hypothetical protein